ncbi:hypothetical protein WT94_11010, partial [Burkholderia stagnalis]
MILKFLIHLTVALVPLSVACPTQAADLLDAVDAARGFDAGIAAAGNARLAGREKRWQGLAGLLPR